MDMWFYLAYVLLHYNFIYEGLYFFVQCSNVAIIFESHLLSHLAA